jgi:hypothetical protein
MKRKWEETIRNKLNSEYPINNNIARKIAKLDLSIKWTYGREIFIDQLIANLEVLEQIVKEYSK